jgi:hypothetical protein
MIGGDEHLAADLLQGRIDTAEAQVQGLDGLDRGIEVPVCPTMSGLA